MKKLLSILLAWAAIFSLSVPALASSYTDVADGAWYAEAVLWASQNRVVNGMGNGRFGTGEATTQEQLVTMLWRDAGAYVLDREKYASAEGVENEASDWAFDAVVWGKAEALFTDAVAFAPKQAASRAQVADMVCRYMRLKEQFANVDAVSGATKSGVLVAYFSATGTTKGVAERLASAVGADLYEIVPAEPYSDADLNWHDKNSRTTTEQNDKSVRPGIASEALDLSGYATIYVGFPIWWGEEPRILDTFVESYDFSGKTMIPFCTSGGSGIGSSGKNLEKLTGGATWLDGKRFSGSAGEDELRAWADGLQ